MELKLKLRGSSLGDVDAALGAGHGGAEEGFGGLAVGGLQADEDEAVGQLEGGGDGGFEAAGVVGGLGFAVAVGSPAMGLRMMRSTMASRVWFLRFSRRMPSSTSVISPSMRTR